MKKQPEQWLAQWLHNWSLVAVSAFAIAAVLVWGIARLQDPRVMPVRVVGVDGEIRYLQRTRLEQTVANAVDGSFFSVDLERVRSQVEQLPWVDSASIRRVWPDRLQVRVMEQQPLARWGKSGLLNPRGEVFRPEPLPDLPGLARLSGPEQQAVAISQTYRRMKTLLGTVGLELSEVEMDARQAWRLKIRGGLQLKLGRQSIMGRLSRFVQLYPRLAEESAAPLKQVDLRYTNGFTLRREALQSHLEKPLDALHPRLAALGQTACVNIRSGRMCEMNGTSRIAGI